MEMNFRLRRRGGDLKKVRANNCECTIYFTCQSYDEEDGGERRGKSNFNDERKEEKERKRDQHRFICLG